MAPREDGGGLPAAARRAPRKTRIDARRWYDASCAAVFAGWVDPALVRRWLFATAARPFASAVVDARRGGLLRLVAGDGAAVVTGRVEDARAPSHVHLTLDHGAQRTTIVATLRPVRGGAALHVRHGGVALHRADWLDGRWSGMLYGLGEALDCDSHEFSHDMEWQ